MNLCTIGMELVSKMMMKYTHRAREVGIQIGRMPTGDLNAIVDVPGVKVGHITLIFEEVRTGVTAILPHDGNIYADKVVAATYVINGYGKSVGLPQIDELGNIETPILLTNTLNVWRVADTVVDYMSGMNRSFLHGNTCSYVEI